MAVMGDVATEDPATWSEPALARLTPAEEVSSVVAAVHGVADAVAMWQDSLDPRHPRRHVVSTIGQCRLGARPQCVVCHVHHAKTAIDAVIADTDQDLHAVMDAAFPAVDIAVPPTYAIEAAVARLRSVGWVRPGLADHARRHLGGATGLAEDLVRLLLVVFLVPRCGSVGRRLRPLRKP